MRQVSQAKRWDDLGPGRHTLRQSRVIESLDFPDEEFGVNLGIVSVGSLQIQTNPELMVTKVSNIHTLDLKRHLFVTLFPKGHNGHKEAELQNQKNPPGLLQTE